MKTRHGALVVLALILGGCSGSPTGPLAHTSEEEKALKWAKSQTPEQQLQAAESNTTLSPSEKQALVQSIKAKYNLK